jgi:hypothetical protein
VYSIAVEDADLGRGSAAGIQVPESGTVNVPPITVKSSGGTLVSVTYDFATGDPLQSAECRITPQEGGMLSISESRGPDGILTVPHVPPGNYTVKISSSNRTDVVHQVTIKAGEITRLEDVLYEASALMVTASDKSGSALADVKCVLTPADSNSIEQPRTGTTNAMGLWMAGSVPVGKYNLTATLGDKHGSKSFDLKTSSHAMQTVTLE